MEVGAWIWTFGFAEKPPFVTMKTLADEDIGRNACPSDDAFVRFAAGYLRDIAGSGVDLIMFDDDFRYGFLGKAPACVCRNHLAAIGKIMGKEYPVGELAENILKGGKNVYRDALLKANGDFLRRFSAAMRDAVDEVDPRVRLGFCACMSTWDLDGTDADELALLLAGNTKPFVRLIGAPYWTVHPWRGDCVSDVVEYERMESAWIRDSRIEIMAEGDSFPRPRCNCPASRLEGFDTAIRASGCTNGILKYGIDYVSNADYEPGYAKAHQRNKLVYEAIDRHFRGKRCVGVRVYEPMKKVSDAVAETRVNGFTDLQEHLFFPMSQRTLSYNTIPTTYEGDGVCGAVFDESARHLPPSALKNGLILDVAAAEILIESGIDVGIDMIGAATRAGETEHFLETDNYILTFGTTVYDLCLRRGAVVLSETEPVSGKRLPMSYRYENADGNRFLVINVNSRFGYGGNGRNQNVYKHYERSRQYAQTIPWLGGKKLPAYCYGNPGLYLMCKEDDAGALAVGLWNYFDDIAFDPVVELAERYSGIEFINCCGRLEGDRVFLDDIPAWGFAGFEIKK